MVHAESVTTNSDELVAARKEAHIPLGEGDGGEPVATRAERYKMAQTPNTDRSVPSRLEFLTKLLYAFFITLLDS